MGPWLAAPEGSAELTLHYPEEPRVSQGAPAPFMAAELLDLVLGAEECRLSPIPSLRHMVGDPRCHHPRNARH